MSKPVATTMAPYCFSMISSFCSKSMEPAEHFILQRPHLPVLKWMQAFVSMTGTFGTDCAKGI